MRNRGRHDEQRYWLGGKDIYDWVNRLLDNGQAMAADTMSASLLVRLLRGAEVLGGDKRAILAAAGLNEGSLRNPLARVSSNIALRFLSALEHHFKDPAVLLHVGDRASMQNFSDLGYATRLEPNLASVIGANVSIQTLRQNMFSTSLDTSSKPPCLMWRYHPDYITAYAPFIELSAATYARLSRQVLGEPPLLRLVDFQHQPRFATEKYEMAFGCQVRFSMPQTRMEIAARQLFRPSPHAHPALLEAASARYVRPADWMAEGKVHLANSYFYLSNALDKSPPTLDRMAVSFGMSERTLRRKLDEEGMAFRDLLDRVRQDLCGLYFLEDKRSLGEIALLLGYSDLSAFSRAYKKWYGVPPSKA